MKNRWDEVFCSGCGKQMKVGHSIMYQLSVRLLDPYHDTVRATDASLKQHVVYCPGCGGAAQERLDAIVRVFDAKEREG